MTEEKIPLDIDFQLGSAVELQFPINHFDFAIATISLMDKASTDAIRGELRPCVSCNFCEEVCPAGIIPHRLHKLIYQDDIDEIERSRVDLCIECGLCSFVCPSKIELTHEFQQAKQAILKEKAAAAAEAAAEEQTDSE